VLGRGPGAEAVPGPPARAAVAVVEVVGCRREAVQIVAVPRAQPERWGRAVRQAAAAQDTAVRAVAAVSDTVARQSAESSDIAVHRLAAVLVVQAVRAFDRPDWV